MGRAWFIRKGKKREEGGGVGKCVKKKSQRPVNGLFSGSGILFSFPFFLKD